MVPPTLCCLNGVQLNRIFFSLLGINVKPSKHNRHSLAAADQQRHSSSPASHSHFISRLAFLLEITETNGSLVGGCIPGGGGAGISAPKAACVGACGWTGKPDIVAMGRPILSIFNCGTIPGRLLLAGIVLCGLMMLTPNAAPAAAPEGEAKNFIESLADRAVQSLTSPEIPEETRIMNARRLLGENFAIPSIGRWILGRYWRQATPEQQDEYLKLFEDMIISIYVERFDQYSGETLTIIDAVAVGEDQDVLVATQLNRAGGNPVKVDWRVRRMDDGLKVVDVLVAGVSLGQTQRSEFSAVIRNNGGSIEALLAEMRQRSRAVRARQG